VNSFEEKARESVPEELCSTDAHFMQVNIGRKCNLTCTHCHLDCSPDREEMMSKHVMEAIIRSAPILACEMIDITGGAPELHPDIRWFITKLKRLGKGIQVRTNLVALLEGPDIGLMEFFKEHHVSLVASMPCYLKENVDAQRGDGVYEKAIEALHKLNEIGYGIKGELPLNLVYNPGGAFLPGPQKELEDSYRKELGERFEVKFSSLLVITNVPIGRFRESLEADNNLEEYMTTLKGAFNPATLDRIMCRHQVCVDWDGRLYDCDFNLAIGLQSDFADRSIEELSPKEVANLLNRTIATASHCFACTAGVGSSCGGSLVSQ
jgi:radical SAM/Cys-rich protein